MSKSIVIGSQQDIAEKQNMSLAESFLSAEIIILLDNSGSMSANDAPGGLTRQEAARQQLVTLQGKHPGKIALICFADRSEYSPGGIILNVGGGTDMVEALRFAKVADDCGLKIVVISDGEPNEPALTLQVARTYETKIDVIYIGPEFPGYGRDFLKQLATATGGSFFKSDKVAELETGIETLLLGG